MDTSGEESSGSFTTSHGDAALNVTANNFLLKSVPLQVKLITTAVEPDNT